MPLPINFYGFFLCDNSALQEINSATQEINNLAEEVKKIKQKKGFFKRSLC